MHRRLDVPAILAMLLAASGAGCHRQPAPTTPVQAQAIEDHCWWTFLLTPLPPDSVASRFQRAFTVVGLTGASGAHSADTAWAQAGPTSLGDDPAGPRYESRVVAYQHGDSTRFRYFLAFVLPARGWRQPTDSLDAERRRLPLCVQIGQAAGVPASRPRRDPNGEDSLAVWKRRP